MFNSHVNKSKAERSREQILHAFESVLSSAITLEIWYEPKDDTREGQVPAISPNPEDSSSNMALRRSFTKHSSVSSRGENLIRRLLKDNVVQGVSSNQTLWMQSDPHILTEDEIIEVRPSAMDWHGEPNSRVVATKEIRDGIVWGAASLTSQDQENIIPQGGKNMNNEHGRQNSVVRGKVSFCHVTNEAETRSPQGGWSTQKATSIADKLEQENLRMEPRSSLLCWNASNTTRRKVMVTTKCQKERTVLLTFTIFSNTHFTLYTHRRAVLTT
ncbi:hypothetical protein GUJ93_ZPchr0005g16256 [Zizania palustris]|uniref:STICHEL DnaA-N-like alpha-beta domain-containing protein n=1 Tax=Zizania palustris TaxID=103762 RepID=A0A8J5VQW2_ZIZPA|nr:hypothetical protein GUJ93_ZPchr0005g16256 [Zizania palustris]